MRNIHTTEHLGLQRAIDFIGQHYIAGWSGEELTAQALPPIEEIKSYLHKLKQDCIKHSLDYATFANVRLVRGNNRRIVKIFEKPVKSLAETFPEYRIALSRYDFAERIPKQYKDDYARYKRQSDALALLQVAISTGLCDALFIDKITGEEKNLSPVLAKHSYFTFNIKNDDVQYLGTAGFLSIKASNLQKALSEPTKEIRITPQKVITEISNNISTGNDIYLTEKEVAQLIGLSLPTLRRWRVENSDKLTFIKLGRSVRYLASDVTEYATKHKQQSTSDTRK